MRHAIILYAVLPAFVGLALLACYFSGVDWLMSLAAHAENREFGVIENLQNATLVAVVWVALRAAGREDRRPRIAWRIVAFGAVFVLLEEIDFGLHYYEHLFDVPSKDRAEVRNLHNQYSSSHYLKQVTDLGMAVFFVLLPLARSRVAESWRRFLPHRLSVATVLISVAVSKTAHWAAAAGLPHNGSLRSNLSEFREVFVYYLWFLYFRQMASLGQESAPEAGEEDDAAI